MVTPNLRLQSKQVDRDTQTIVQYSIYCAWVIRTQDNKINQLKVDAGQQPKDLNKYIYIYTLGLNGIESRFNKLYIYEFRLLKIHLVKTPSRLTVKYLNLHSPFVFFHLLSLHKIKRFGAAPVFHIDYNIYISVWHTLKGCSPYLWQPQNRCGRVSAGGT